MTRQTPCTRREWMATAAAVLAAPSLLHAAKPQAPARVTATGPTREGDPAGERPRAGERRLRIGMCDWSIGRRDPSAFELGQQISLDGIEVSAGDPSHLWLRDAKLQREYVETARQHAMAIPSLAMGQLNHVPLASEPRAAVWLADAIDIAKAMGARCILVAFFGKGELRADNTEDMRRVAELLVELAPRAEKAGVILGLENYLTAEDNLKIIEQVRSDCVQVYYDVYNSWVSRSHDPVHEIKLLGAKRICQVHLKEGGQFLGASRKIDWPAVAAALHDIHYPGWLVLETSAPTGDMVKDTRANLDYVRRTFAPLVS